MIVTIKNKREVSEFYKQSDPRLKTSRLNGGKDSLTAWVNKYGQLITGLTEEEEDRLGKALDKNLHKKSDFWLDYFVSITGEELVLNTEYPEDELKYLLLKSHFRVQPDPNKNNPRADYVIHSTLDDAKKTVSIGKIKVQAYTAYNQLTMQDKRDLLKLYPGYSRTDNVVDDIIESNLLKEMDKDYEKFIKRVEDKDRNSKVLVEELVAHKILLKNKNMYKYGEDVLGHNLESTISHLNDPKNQGLKIALMQELKDLKK